MGCVNSSRFTSAKKTIKDSGPSSPVDVSHVKDAVPKVEPKSRYGNPEYYEIAGQRYFVLNSSAGFTQKGGASWYGRKFHGRRTSSGESYDMYAMTAAHKTLPLPTYVQVTNLLNGNKVVVKVNDRGPFHPERIIDLSYAAAKKLNFLKQGTASVEIKALTPGVPASKISTGYLVQVGAFSDAVKAEKFAWSIENKLQQKIEVSAVQLNQALVYRVRLGPFLSRKEANLWLNRAHYAGFGDAKLVTISDKWYDL